MPEKQLSTKTHSKALGRLKMDLPAYVLLIPSILCLFLFTWRPIVEGFCLSVFKLQGYQPVQFVGFRNYMEIMRDSQFIKTLINTFSYVGWSFVIGFVPPIVVAIIVNELRSCKGFVRFSIYFPSMTPAIITSLMWTLLYNPGPGGLLNTILMNLGFEAQPWLNDANNAIIYIVITMTWGGFGGTAVLYMSSLQGISNDLYEAAFIDGASLWRRIWHITLPQISSIILLMFIKQFSGVFQIFNEPLMMTGGGPNNATVTLSLLGYRFAFVYFQLEKALTVGVITFVILLVLTSFYFWVEKKVTIDE